VLHSFAGGTDGANPAAGLIVDSSGNLYGTTEFGGGGGNCSSVASGCGVVFELAKASGYEETILYHFTGQGDGGLPVASLVMDNSKDLYGTATCGGESNCAGMSAGNGVVFELVYSGSSYSSTPTVLHSFTGGSGGVPVAPVILDSAGNLYGTTKFGGGTGTLCSSSGCGVVFTIVKSGGVYKLLHSFVGTDGAQPTAGLTLHSSGNLYGTTFEGGTSGAGVVFTLRKSGADYGVLYSFEGKSDGGNPAGGVIEKGKGGKGGCTGACGSTVNGGSGFGVVFQISPL
jgi:hypothetical protein